MKTFFSDIIPRIQKYSQKLDDVTLLTNQHWVVLDILSESKTVYIFRQNGELLISINGKVSKAKWEYLGHNSILIDINEESYLFKPNIFDENILALKIDSKDEYAILVNETKYSGEFNSISAVNHFLHQKYIQNPIPTQKKLAESSVYVLDEKFVTDKYTLKMGVHKEYNVFFNNGKTITVYLKLSNGKYFIYTNNEILFFQNRKECLTYLITSM